MARIYALAIDDNMGVELHMFKGEDAMNVFLWEYAFENSGTDAETLAEFKASLDGDLDEAMEMTGDGYKYEWMEA